MKQVAFDESGNSGQNLFDSQDPVFALGSCHFDMLQTNALMSLFTGVQALELKFTKLSARPRYQEKILQFFESPHVTSETMKIAIVQKPFMVVTKYVDLVIVPSFEASGIKPYKQGLNLATANLLAIVGPQSLPGDLWTRFLESFSQFVWRKDLSAWSKFQYTSEEVYGLLSIFQPKLADFIGAAMLLKGKYASFIKSLNDDELDPIVPSYQILADKWGRQLNERFQILADESKVLTRYKQVYLMLSNPKIPAVEAGYNSRTIQFPLKVDSIVPVDSLKIKDVQFADLACGAACCFLKNSNRHVPGSFENRLMKLFLRKELIVHHIWPSKVFDPKGLEADSLDDDSRISVNEFTEQVLAARRRQERT